MELFVWEPTAAADGTELFVWNRMPTGYRVGSKDELRFWRVMATGATDKEFFYHPAHYCNKAGVDPSTLKDTILHWEAQQAEAQQDD